MLAKLDGYVKTLRAAIDADMTVGEATFVNDHNILDAYKRTVLKLYGEATCICDYFHTALDERAHSYGPVLAAQARKFHANIQAQDRSTKYLDIISLVEKLALRGDVASNASSTLAAFELDAASFEADVLSFTQAISRCCMEENKPAVLVEVEKIRMRIEDFKAGRPVYP